MPEIDLEKEKQEILQAYRGLLRAAKHSKKDAATKKRIRKAFDVALDAHKDMRRKSGEPYIYHPIAVARICAEEIGLGATSIICALLHDTVEDTEITIADVENLFGTKEAQIIDGLTKISGVVDHNVSLQAENFRKILLTLSKDVRVILIKLADRLHNMRTLGSMRRDKQLKIASETLFLYAPLAHRLGLHAIKSELEDLSLKYKEPEQFAEIETKLKKTQAVRTRFINQFSLPIKKSLEEKGLKFEIKGRPKSIHSIWNKMVTKNVLFEEVYDLFAIRIIIDSKSEASEKSDCWQVYSVVTDFYQPNIERLRDWISVPKANGYESLHTTVMSPTGKWVEVQIRTNRMNEIAEKGFAAHWKYKEGGAESQFDAWINQVREMLENQDENALDFMDDFKLNLFSDEIFIFTPDGDMKSLPTGASALDFAFSVHTQVGTHCLGAKVNNKLVPLSYQLKSGDQVEILTSQKQKPKEDWLSFVKTHRAKSKIKSSLKEEKRAIAKEGELILEKEFKKHKITYENLSIKALQTHFKVSSPLELYYKIAVGEIKLKGLKDLEVKKGLIRPKRTIQKRVINYFGQKSTSQKEKSKSNVLVFGSNMEKLDYKFATCCNPISGDEVFGFITVTEGIKVHKTNCPNAVQLMSNYAYRIIKAQWVDEKKMEFLTGLKIIGIDDKGIVNNITQVVSNDLSVNMRSLNFDSHDGIFEGIIMVFVQDVAHLKNLTKKLLKVKGIKRVERIDKSKK
jgi:GTP pyrophosphokinase